MCHFQIAEQLIDLEGIMSVKLSKEQFFLQRHVLLVLILVIIILAAGFLLRPELSPKKGYT